jgi:hypothetical protein
LDIRQLGDLGDIAKLGLTLSEGKQVLACLQQVVVAVQTDDHAVLRPDCSSCGQACHVKDWRAHRVATLFGTVAMRLPRFRCAGCGDGEIGISWLSYCRSTRARSAKGTYFCTDAVSRRRRVADASSAGRGWKQPRDVARPTLKVGEQLRDVTVAKPVAGVSAITVTCRQTRGPRSSPPAWRS